MASVVRSFVASVTVDQRHEQTFFEFACNAVLSIPSEVPIVAIAHKSEILKTSLLRGDVQMRIISRAGQCPSQEQFKQNQSRSFSEY